MSGQNLYIDTKHKQRMQKIDTDWVILMSITLLTFVNYPYLEQRAQMTGPEMSEL